MTYRQLTFLIRGCAYAVYNELGPGMLESVYENAMVIELQSKGLDVQQQLPIPIKYKGNDMGIAFRCDIVVENAVILELKSVERLLPVHKKQLISYLKLTDMRVGYLINFNEADINNGLERVLYKFNEEDDISQIIK